MFAGKSDNSCLYPVNLADGIRICKDVKCFYRSLLSEGTKRMPDAPERRSQTCTSETCPRREPIHHNDILCIWEKKVLFKKNCYTKRCNIFHQPLIQVHLLHKYQTDRFCSFSFCVLFTFFKKLSEGRSIVILVGALLCVACVDWL